MANDKIVYSERAVAFVDILGFKSLIASVKQDDSAIRNLHRALHRIKIIEAQAGAPNTVQKDLQVSVFSDCIAISASITQVPQLIWTVGYLQADLLLGGTLTRGGIASGWLHHEDGIIYGEGLNTAFEMEQNKAVFPRVLIAPNLMDGLRPGVKRLLREDDDGHWHIDPFRFEATVGGAAELAADGWDPRELYFEEVRKHLAKQLGEATGSERITAKIKWIIQRFNDALSGQAYTRCSPINFGEQL